MKPILPMPTLTAVLLIAASPLVAQEAGPAPSNTSGAERTVQIIWAPGGNPPDVTTVLRRLVTDDAAKVGQKLLNVDPGVASKMVSLNKVSVSDRSCTASFSIYLNIPKTHAKPAAKEFADELVERLASLFRDDRSRGAMLRLEEATDEATRLEQEMEALRKQRRQIQAEMGGKTPEALQAMLTKLEDEKQRLELELAGMEARLEAVQEQIEQATVRGQKEASADPVIPELEKAVAARQKLVDLTRKRVDAGAATPQELSAAEAELSEARVQLLDRRAAGSARGGEAIAPLTRELQNLAIDIRDRKARLAYAEKHLRPLGDAAALLDDLQTVQAKLQIVTRRWEETQTRAREARSRAEAGPVDRVIVTHATDSLMPPDAAN